MTSYNKEFLELIFKNADIGRNSIGKLIPKCEDGGLRSRLRSQYDDLNRICMSAATLIRSAGGAVKSAAAANFAASAMIALNVTSDRSNSNLASMVIKGNQRGIREIEQKLKAFPDADMRIVNLAKSLEKHLTENTLELKRYI